METGSLPRLALLSYYMAYTLEFLRHVLIGRYNLIKSVRDFSWQSDPSPGEPHGEVPIPHALKAG